MSGSGARRVGRAGAGLTAASALLLFLAFLPVPTPHLVWVALVPWLLHVERGMRDGAATRAAARSGAGLFALFWGLHLSWVLVLAPRLGALWPLWAYAGQVLLLALLGAVAGAGIHQFRVQAGVPLPLAAAAGWVAVEWLRGHLLGPLRFPWSPVALPLADLPDWVQPAAWVGESGLGAGVLAVNGVVALAWVRRAEAGALRWRPSRPALLAVAAHGNRLLSSLLGYAPMLTPGKLRELRQPDWLADNAAF
ncbi:MAG: hypothetical protein RQ751_10030, partial [Longimicrobiales bacterium]|nr:hypothetical protein [Longimicrobiales bacterium]